MICVVVLQNCVGFVEGTTGSCSETRVTCDVDGTEEVSIKVEEAIDIKDEMPDSLTVEEMKTENEVRLWGVCVCV
jgi:low affinity Fe/Cu permease